MSIRTLGDRVLVKVIKPSKEYGGIIIIPDTCYEAPVEGIVEDIGSKADGEDGSVCVSDIKIGDKILIPEVGTDVKVDGKEFRLVRSVDILAVLED